MEDQFQKKMDLRSENVAKNEIKRMRNIVRARKEPVPRAGYIGPETASASQLTTAISIAKASTASVGKFQDAIPKEKQARGIGVKELIPGTKRKASHISDVPEKVHNLELINSVLRKKPKIDEDKAIQVQKREQRAELVDICFLGFVFTNILFVFFRREANPEQKKRKKGSISKKHLKSHKRAISAKKPKAGAGERDPKKRAVGRKRR